MRVNPFFELYVGDRLSSKEFVDIFSPFLVRHAEALFLPGNVVVKGVQGSGKSMLLSLLKPDVRMEYARAAAPFPVPSHVSRFIGAGINLAHSNAIDFGYRSISEDPNETSLFFADFVNFTVLLDIFSSIRILANPIGSVATDLAINIESPRMSAFVEALAASDVFQGSLLGCKTLEDVEIKIRSRLNAYRRFLHMNDSHLDGSIRESKTDIGTPISVTVNLLKRAQVIGNEVAVFIHVDQYEELANISPSEHSPDYRKVINRALARRDPAISYRIGTRGHAWRNHGYIFGAQAKLEEERDYKFVDLDEMLRRRENSKTWIFPAFVEDVFARRLKHVGLAPASATGRQLLEGVFGVGLTSVEKALKYSGGSPRRAIKVDPEWAEDFKEFIFRLTDSDPLSARLLEAWTLQRLTQFGKKKKKLQAGDLSMALFNEMRAKPWWIKERVDLALIQIASRCQQRPLWAGYAELIDISGGSILTFLSICQFVWDTHSQIGVHAEKSRTDLVEIEVELQAIGVFKASDYWLKKITQETGRSGDRFRLTRHIGNVLSKALYADRQMSYPGHNGFSIADDELQKLPTCEGAFGRNE